MKTLLLFAFTLFLFSCNNGKDEAGKLQHQNDSLKAAIQVQAQQKQIDSLKNSVNKMQANADAKDQSKQETSKKQMFAYWQTQQNNMSAQLDYDNATLKNVSDYHLGRLPSKRKEEIAQASVKLENDKLKAQQINDSVNKYKE